MGNQQVNVVGLAVELDQLPPPVLAPLRGNLVQAIEHRRGDARPPVLGNNNQVILKSINAVQKLV